MSQPAATGSSSLIESHIQDYVPEDERHGRVWQQAPFWFMTNATFATALTGVVGFGLGLSLPWTIVAIVLGSVFGTFFSAFHAVQGPALGLPQLIQSRVQFGSKGAVLPKLIVVIVQFGFGLFYTVLAADAMGQITRPNPRLFGAVFLVVAIVIVALGHDVLHRLLRWLTIFTVIDFVILTVAVFKGAATSTTVGAGGFVLSGFMAQFGASAGYQIAIAPIVSDYTRYLPKTTPAAKIVAAVGLGSMFSAIWLEIVGAVVVAATKTQDVIGAMNSSGNSLVSGFGTFSLALSVPVQILIAGVSIYSGFLSGVSALDSFKTVRPRVSFRLIGLTLVGLVILGAILLLPRNYVNSFVTFLFGLLYFFIPWTAVNLTDYYISRKGRYSIADIVSPSGGLYGMWSWRGLTAYFVGLAAMVPFFDVSWYTGPIAKSLRFDIAALVGLPVTCVVYFLLARSIDLNREQQAIACDPQKLAALRRSVPAA